VTVAGAPRHRLSPRARRAGAEAEVDSVRRVPRHELSPRARRQPAGAEASAEQTAPLFSGNPPTGRQESAWFAVGESDVDVTGLGGAVLAYVARAAAEAMPPGPVHLAIGVGGPVVRDAGDLSLTGLTRRLSALDAGAPRAGATLTIVVSGLTAETVPPEPGQIGALVVGEIVERPAVVRLPDGGPGIAVRSFARLTFSYDHRALRRDDAARFLTAVKHRLEAPWTSAG
jgi:pyruvate/2-oxoglutarate dehydrogenase complex dihydrolipoamide acyltransferase (E2) component